MKAKIANLLGRAGRLAWLAIGAAFRVLLGTFLLWVGCSLLIALVKTWSSTSWAVVLFVLLITPLLVLGGTVLTLSPLRHIPIVARAIERILAAGDWMVKKLEAAQILNWAGMAFLLLYAIPVLGWKVMELGGWAPVLPEKAYTYVALVVAAVVFTYWGRLITYRTTRKKRREGHAEVFGLLQPHNIRFVVFGLMALAYVAANLEKFSGMTLTHAPWWRTYKDVLVEVLLSYTAIDSMLVAWRDAYFGQIDHLFRSKSTACFG